ncbi:MAG: diguanylate cyclase [Candidatus Omnitrophota bacterium]|jgi:diguanylate cyclase (GGDEF)-like protein
MKKNTGKTYSLDVFNSLPDRAFIVDPKDYTIVDVNNAYLKKEGLKREDVIGRKCYEVTHKNSSPCRGALERCPLRDTVKTKKSSVSEHLHYDKNNNPYYVDIITSVIKDRSKNKDLILHICRPGQLLKDKKNEVAKKSRRYIRQLKNLAIKDPLTGVYNYRYLMDRLPAEVYRSRRYKDPLSLALLDIDYFKSINDVYGHRTGDKALEEFAQFIKSSLRQSDIMARYGGEEFVVLMPHTDKLGAQYLANRLINKLRKHIFNIEKSEIKLKISIGVATLSLDEYCDTSDKLLSAADKAMQRAKESGSNMAVAYSGLYKGKGSTQEKTSPYEEVNILKRKITKLSERVDRVVLESMYAFSKSMEARDYYTAEHSDDMVDIVLRIGKEIGLDQDMLNNLERGATLHDVGKIGISDAILLKKGKLTPEEYETIKMHPKVGAEIIRSIHFLKDVVPIVLHHHEKWDGTGYPSGLKGKEIPLLARIVGIADAYQALASDRPYRKAYSKKEALNILKKEAGTHFDKDLVNILIKLER